MFRTAARYLALLTCLFSVTTLSAQQKEWLKEYQKYEEYDGIYVVRKVAVPCRTYETYLTDASGRKLTPPLRDIGVFSEGLAEFVPMETDPDGQGLHGFLDRQGKVVIEPKYAGTEQFREGKTWVIYKAGKQFGLSYIDKEGKTLYRIPVEQFPNDFLISKATLDHLCAQDTREDIMWLRDGDMFLLNWNFSKFNEKEIKSSKHIYHFNFRGKYGIIDRNMILRIPVALDDIDPTYKFSGQGLERVQYGDKYGYISPFTGDLIVPFQYEETRKPTNGLFWVKKNNKWGAIDKTGKVHINYLYDEATGFTSENRSAVAINGKFGHIDKSGKVRTPLKYDFASYFNNGRSMVRVGDKYGYIDTLDKYVIEPIYDEALPFDEKTTVAERSWLRYQLALDGTETFIGFSYKLNAVFIILGVLVFVWLNSLLFQKLQSRRAAKATKTRKQV